MKKIFIIGTACALISSSFCLVNAKDPKFWGEKGGVRSAEGKGGDLFKKIEALDKKLRDAGDALNKDNIKVAVKNIHEYLVGMAELRKKGGERMKESFNKKGGKGGNVGDKKDSGESARKK